MRHIGFLQVIQSSGSLRIKLIKLLDYIFGTVLSVLVPAQNTARTLPHRISRILIIRPGGIGDAVFLLPFLQLIKKRHPGWQIDILCEHRNKAVFDAHSHLVERIYCYDNWPVTPIRKRLYDVVIDSEQWHYLSGWIAYITKTPFRIGFNTRPLRKKFFNRPVEFGTNDHELMNFRRLLEVIEPEVAKVTDTAGSYDVSSHDDEWAAGQLKAPSVAFFVGASIPERRLTQDQMIDIIQYLRAHKLQPVLLGGSDVSEASQKLKQRLGEGHCLDFVGKISLPKSVALIKNCKFFIGPDSGLMHLAAAVKTPVVAIFGPGNLKKWGPRGNKDATVTLNVSCSPCTAFGYTVPTCHGTYHCMRTITIDHLKDHLTRLIKNI